MDEDKNPARQPKMKPFAGALPQDGAKYYDQNRKRDEVRKRAEIHAAAW